MRRDFFDQIYHVDWLAGLVALRPDDAGAGRTALAGGDTKAIDLAAIADSRTRSLCVDAFA